MTVKNILESTSFNTLGEAEQAAVSELFAVQYLKGDKHPLDIPLISEKRHILALSQAIHQARIAKTNPAAFSFLSSEKQTALRHDLLFSFYILSAQYQLDEAEDRRQNLTSLAQQLKKCAFLINRLLQARQRNTAESHLHCERDYTENHCKYLGLTQIGPFVADKMLEFSGGQTIVFKDWMNDINERRMYWVWGGDMLDSVLSMLPDNFAHTQQAKNTLHAPTPYMGIASWLLYYTRFGINLSLLLKHALAGPWMSQDEMKIPMGERFKTQWDQRKFALLNDSIWATVNLVTYCWLNGRGMLGYWGNALTAGLLLVDASLTMWRYLEEETRHNVTIQRYERDIETLNQSIKQLEQAPDEARITELKQQLVSLGQDKKRLELNWNYKKYQLITDLTYALSLFAAFIVLVSFLLPPAAIVPATAMILQQVGAVLCFCLSMAYKAFSGRHTIAKTQETGEQVQYEHDQLRALFNDTDDDNVKKQLYLDIKQLMADSAYQKELVRFQKIKLVQSLFIDGFIPPLVFVALIFLPLGAGLGVLAAGLALAAVSKIILDRFEPSAPEVEYTLVIDNDATYEAGKIYLKEKQGKITYSLVAPSGEAILNIKTQIDAPKPFTLEKLKPLKKDIMAVTSTRGHTQAQPVFDEKEFCSFKKNKHCFFSSKPAAKDRPDYNDQDLPFLTKI